jgi:metal-responsive CopG/Arc/MetJ family transcriptional regulator
MDKHAEEMVRAHIVIPEELVREVDALVGHRQRSQFFTDAVREKVKRIKLTNAASKAAGSLAPIPIPGWETSQEAARWVHASRHRDALRLDHEQEER